MPLISFDTVKGMISGNTGCNDFTGDAVYTGNTIDVGGLIATKIACPDMETEDRFFEIINNQIVTFKNTVTFSPKTDPNKMLVL
ncbi:MAG: META domain-containing protein [Actinobacteria bacterium]|nr:META domain-containing protein [Actinomycetota bacterium]